MAYTAPCALHTIAQLGCRLQGRFAKLRHLHYLQYPQGPFLPFFHSSSICIALQYWSRWMSSLNFVFPDAGGPSLAHEKNLLIGGFLGCGAWGKFLPNVFRIMQNLKTIIGIHLCVFSAAMYFSFISLPHRQQRTRLFWVLMAYMTVIFAFATAYIGANIQVNGASSLLLSHIPLNC